MGDKVLTFQRHYDNSIFIKYKDPFYAKKALNLNGTYFKDRLIKVFPDLREMSEANMIINWIPIYVNYNQFHSLFSSAGHILTAKLQRSLRNPNYNVGFVLYENIEDAKNCQKMFDGSKRFGYDP